MHLHSLSPEGWFLKTCAAFTLDYDWEGCLSICPERLLAESAPSETRRVLRIEPTIAPDSFARFMASNPALTNH
jgi:hypothetical protein